MDATRVSDGAMVIMKPLFRCRDADEIDFTHAFSVEPLASNPRNHCIRQLEAIKVPEFEDMVLLVLPFLRPFHKPQFLTVGEGIHFMRQLLEVW